MIAGIETEEPGFQYIHLHPRIPAQDSLAFVKAQYDSPHGRISTHWYHENDVLRFDVTIPPNTTALIRLPAKKGQTITENDDSVAFSKQFIDFKRGESFSTFRAASGTYRFKVQ